MTLRKNRYIICLTNPRLTSLCIVLYLRLKFSILYFLNCSLNLGMMRTEEIVQWFRYLICMLQNLVWFLIPHFIPWALPGWILEHRARNKPSELLGVPPSQIARSGNGKEKKYNKNTENYVLKKLIFILIVITTLLVKYTNMLYNIENFPVNS